MWVWWCNTFKQTGVRFTLVLITKPTEMKINYPHCGTDNYKSVCLYRCKNVLLCLNTKNIYHICVSQTWTKYWFNSVNWIRTIYGESQTQKYRDVLVIFVALTFCCNDKILTSFFFQSIWFFILASTYFMQNITRDHSCKLTLQEACWRLFVLCNMYIM